MVRVLRSQSLKDQKTYYCGYIIWCTWIDNVDCKKCTIIIITTFSFPFGICLKKFFFCLRLASLDGCERVRATRVREVLSNKLKRTGLEWLTVLNDLMANRFAIIVEKPGARQLWAMKPSFNSAKQITSSPCFQSHDGMFSKYACWSN